MDSGPQKQQGRIQHPMTSTGSSFGSPRRHFLASSRLFDTQVECIKKQKDQSRNRTSRSISQEQDFIDTLCDDSVSGNYTSEASNVISSDNNNNTNLQKVQVSDDESLDSSPRSPVESERYTNKTRFVVADDLGSVVISLPSYIPPTNTSDKSELNLRMSSPVHIPETSPVSSSENSYEASPCTLEAENMCNEEDSSPISRKSHRKNQDVAEKPRKNSSRHTSPGETAKSPRLPNGRRFKGDDRRIGWSEHWKDGREDERRESQDRRGDPRRAYRKDPRREDKRNCDERDRCERDHDRRESRRNNKKYSDDCKPRGEQPLSVKRQPSPQSERKQYSRGKRFKHEQDKEGRKNLNANKEMSSQKKRSCREKLMFKEETEKQDSSCKFKNTEESPCMSEKERKKEEKQWNSLHSSETKEDSLNGSSENINSSTPKDSHKRTRFPISQKDRSLTPFSDSLVDVIPQSESSDDDTTASVNTSMGLSQEDSVALDVSKISSASSVFSSQSELFFAEELTTAQAEAEYNPQIQWGAYPGRPSAAFLGAPGYAERPACAGGSSEADPDQRFKCLQQLHQPPKPNFCGYQLIGDSILLRFAQKILGDHSHWAENLRFLGLCVSGQRIGELLRRLRTGFYHVGKKVIVLIGTNDLLKNTPLTQMCAQLFKVVEHLRKEADQIVVLTLPPIPRLEAMSYHWQRLNGYNEYIKKLPFVDSGVSVLDLFPLYVRTKDEMEEEELVAEYNAKTLLCYGCLLCTSDSDDLDLQEYDSDLDKSDEIADIYSVSKVQAQDIGSMFANTKISKCRNDCFEMFFADSQRKDMIHLNLKGLQLVKDHLFKFLI